MATGINTLKKWFSTGLKPTQDQFWAWLDSYWHKDEKIPMQNIEGIDTALENKAETTAVDAKANADASELSAENIISWKKALGVGDLPKNIATIDKDGEQGNVYNKTQVDDLLESSGKNVANSCPTSEAGAGLVLGGIWSIKTNGFPLRIEDLPDETGSPIPAGKLMVREDGTFVVNKEADVDFNFPDNFSANLTINHIYPSVIPERPAFADDVKRILGNIRNYTWEEVDKSLRVAVGNSKVSTDILPYNKDFIIKMIFPSGGRVKGIGIGRDNIFEYGFISGGNHFEIRPNRTQYTGSSSSILFNFIVKTGEILTFITTFGSELIVNSFRTSDFGDFNIIYAYEDINDSIIKYHILN